MSDVSFHVIAWPAFGLALLVFGFAPGAVLRLIVLAFSRDDPRRRELLAELYAVPRIERPFWVAEQLEVALFEGLRGRLRNWRAQRVRPATMIGSLDGFGEITLLIGDDGKLYAGRHCQDGSVHTDMTVSPSSIRALAKEALSAGNGHIYRYDPTNSILTHIIRALEEGVVSELHTGPRD